MKPIRPNKPLMAACLGALLALWGPGGSLQGAVLYHTEFDNLSGWAWDPRVTPTLTNGNVLLHLNRSTATDPSNWSAWFGGPWFQNFIFTIPTTRTLELRADVVGANQDDAFAALSINAVSGTVSGYSFFKDQNEVVLVKCCTLAFLDVEEVVIKNDNITLSMALTPRGSDLEIHLRVFDRDNQNALLWEKRVMDTSGIDPTIASGSWKELVVSPEVNAAPYLGQNSLVTFGCAYLNTERAPESPGAEVTFDSFTVLEYEPEGPELTAHCVGNDMVISWPDTMDSCYAVEHSAGLAPLDFWSLLPHGRNNPCAVPMDSISGFFRLVQLPCLAITPWDTSPEVPLGESITLQVQATGHDPLSYQWRFNAEILKGVTGNSLTIDNAQPSDQGEYVVTVTDPGGSVTNEPATLTVLAVPTIVEQPQDQTAQVGETVTFSVTVTNTATLPIGVTWRKEPASVLSRQVLNEFTSTCSITNVQLTDAGTYFVTVTNAASYTPGERSRTSVLTVAP